MCGPPPRQLFVQTMRSEVACMYKTKVFDRGAKRTLEMKVAGKTENLHGIMQ